MIKKKIGLIWVDLETTGLNTAKDAVLEIACIATDGHLNVVGDYHCYTAWPGIRFDAFIENMHTESGLIADYEKVCAENWASVNTYPDLDTALVDWVKPLWEVYNWEVMYFAGSTVEFDAQFLSRITPEFFKLMHHRKLNISSFKILGEMEQHEFLDTKNHLPEHRARNDVKNSLEWFRNNIFSPGSLT